MPASQVSGGCLAGLDVGLIEGIDSQDRSGHRSGHLPSKDLLAQVVAVRHRDPDEGTSTPLQIPDGLLLLPVSGRVQPKVEEQPVLSIDPWRPHRLAFDRNEALPVLSGGLGQQLLQPGPHPRDFRGGDQSELVPACLGQGGQDDAQDHPGIFVRGDLGVAGLNHGAGPMDELGHIQPHQGCRHFAEVRQRRVASPDRRLPEEDGAEALPFGHFLQPGPGVGDGDKPPSGFRLTQDLPDPVEEILFQDIGFQGAAGLAGDDEERSGQVDRGFETVDLAWVGGVQDVKFRVSLLLAEGRGQNFGKEAGTSHSQ